MNASSSSFADVVENVPVTSVVALFDRFTDLIASMTGGVDATFETVTVTPADVVVFPAASRARADRVWLPLATLVEFHAIWYGATVTSVPTLAPSSRNWTPATATLSVALADTVTALPVTVAPAAGAVSDTVGATRSLLTVTFTAVDVVTLPAPSRAIAVREWTPFATVPVFHEIEYGLAVSSVPRLTPSNWNWTPTTAMLSAAVAESVTVLPATVAPFAGAEIATVGGVAATLLTVTDTAVGTPLL